MLSITLKAFKAEANFLSLIIISLSSPSNPPIRLSSASLFTPSSNGRYRFTRFLSISALFSSISPALTRTSSSATFLVSKSLSILPVSVILSFSKMSDKRPTSLILILISSLNNFRLLTASIMTSASA